jgi:hypothetical protein
LPEVEAVEARRALVPGPDAALIAEKDCIAHSGPKSVAK